MRHPVLECIPARAATHPPKQPATQEPAESQAASRAPSSAPGEAQHQQPQQQEQPTSTLNSPPSPPAGGLRLAIGSPALPLRRGANSLVIRRRNLNFNCEEQKLDPACVPLQRCQTPARCLFFFFFLILLQIVQVPAIQY